jgi:hypothetical protein
VAWTVNRDRIDGFAAIAVVMEAAGRNWAHAAARAIAMPTTLHGETVNQNQ